MTLTRSYTATHNALTAGAARANLPGPEKTTAMRALLAVADRKGTATYPEIAADLLISSQFIAKIMRGLYTAGLATGKASDGGPPRAPFTTTATLTPAGRDLAAWIRKQASRETTT